MVYYIYRRLEGYRLTGYDLFNKSNFTRLKNKNHREISKFPSPCINSLQGEGNDKSFL